MSNPVAAVTPVGWVNVSSGSTTASVGRNASCDIPVLTDSPITSRTHTVVDSEPVPVVVGTAISGRSGSMGDRPAPTGRLT
ncbi:hypothetical protein GCM10009810_12840 [Nostocoides vanveenii]|jgi:hypothetical protein|uniref:FHA domain-containing protein n=1 Tax=Nostocoides vanveenii TaxID=330835 RepID=A0ABP4WL37_9MICO